MNLKDYKTVKDRRVALEKALGISLPHIGSFTSDEAIASARNCENMIGTTQIPLGVAGPLKISNFPSASFRAGKFQISNYYIPLATTEGALVASVNRGCKMIFSSGGATVHVENVGATRGPVFRTRDLASAFSLKQWVLKNQKKLGHIAQTTSSHIKLLTTLVEVVGNRVYIRFSFDTGKAMGMNMVTIASGAMCDFIQKETNAMCEAVAGNFDIDKKPAYLNQLLGRGKKVWAEAVLPSKAIASVLHVSAQQMYDVWLSKCMIGSALSGSLSYTCHVGNSIAAIFLACGQDPAHITEGSIGFLTTEVLHDQGDLRVSLYLPDIMVGMIGGGTGLSTQKEALSILGVDDGNVEYFAGIVGAAALAGEISLLGSLAEGSLARAHARLGRGKK